MESIDANMKPNEIIIPMSVLLVQACIQNNILDISPPFLPELFGFIYGLLGGHMIPQIRVFPTPVILNAGVRALNRI